LQIDLLHDISQSVGRKFKHQQNSDTSWQGQFEKEDVTLLTKLIRNKTGGSLYNEIAEEQATVLDYSVPSTLTLIFQLNGSHYVLPFHAFTSAHMTVSFRSGIVERKEHSRERENRPPHGNPTHTL